ncbi:hypothetical protein [Nocardioides sp. CFH 31398]|uniref:hypothetical protein n=1 Tax=Nocardioides sp. CFH 31398 TaxID=2919579 RepID=UPI001F06FABC|nr:hypothetical protein [Nocardioides sp. CFH 31398]MCH1864967.1 hypothetical protein [Nocardioides sp. CFH 31398]
MEPDRAPAPVWRTRLTVASAVLAVAAVVVVPGVVGDLTRSPAVAPPADAAAPDPAGFLTGDAVCPAAEDAVSASAGQPPPVVDALGDLRAETEGLQGYAGQAVSDEGRVLLYWREPVPASVRDLAGRRPDGVEVVVAPTAFSAADVASGLALVGSALATAGTSWTAVAGCADSSGLRVEVDESVEDPGALGAELSSVAGMPVTVVVAGAAGEGAGEGSG